MFTVDFLVTETIGQNAPQRAWVLNAFYSFLKTQAEDWNAVLADIRERYGAYANAANDPHPKYGRGYPLGKVFASIVGREADLAVISLGAERYGEAVKSLTPIIRRSGVA